MSEGHAGYCSGSRELELVDADPSLDRLDQLRRVVADPVLEHHGGIPDHARVARQVALEPHQVGQLASLNAASCFAVPRIFAPLSVMI